ncbi:F-box/kelch-repeat protein At1g22040-like [Phragmites australis]|uniref:F-box/kelch-repeat protein At1g22040-like n=1 Tax=Phragmites australis TaxID=29695 RepID=UPI002D7956BA|nr:F-box/kelch-repeat protein At1g22040-like [Phragmites australis]
MDVYFCKKISKYKNKKSRSQVLAILVQADTPVTGRSEPKPKSRTPKSGPADAPSDPGLIRRIHAKAAHGVRSPLPDSANPRPHLRLHPPLRSSSAFAEARPDSPFATCRHGSCSLDATGGGELLLGTSALVYSSSAPPARPEIRAFQFPEVSPMITGRAFCKVALLRGKLYVVGGVSRGRNSLLPLRSAEVFDPKTGLWSELPEMPFEKAHVLPTAFLDVLKPIATGMAPYKGKLYVPQSLYSWPFFFEIGGEIYDPELNSWSTMPDGLGYGWPARQAGTKLGIVINDKLYTLQPSSSLDSGQIKRYDSEEDTWITIEPQVPVNDFTDAEAPYLLAGLHGRLHVITKSGNNNLEVMQAVVQNNTDNNASEENVLWTTVSSKNFGAAELVSCQVLDV